MLEQFYRKMFFFKPLRYLEKLSENLINLNSLMV